MYYTISSTVSRLTEDNIIEDSKIDKNNKLWERIES